MNNPASGRWALWLSFPLALLVAVESLVGILLPSVYASENRLYAGGAVAADIINLFVVVPALAVTAILALRGWLGARLVWTSTVLYVVYAFIYYTLDVRFNALFWLYCAVQGLSFYLLAGTWPGLPVEEIARRYRTRAPVIATAVLFLLIVAGAGMHWVQETVPLMLAGSMPRDVREGGHITDVPAVLDIAFLLPALTIGAILLLRRRPVAFALGPVLLAFDVFVGLLLVAISGMMAVRGFGANAGGFIISGTITGASAILLALFLRKPKSTPAPA